MNFVRTMLSAGMLSLVTGGAAAAPTPEQNIQVVGAFGEAVFGRKDFSVLPRLMREDYIQHNPLCPRAVKVSRRSSTLRSRPFRTYEILPLRCAQCGAQMRLIAFVTAPASVNTILAHLGEPTTPPEVARARGPPLWEQAPEPLPNWNEAPARVPEFVFDQRVSW